MNPSAGVQGNMNSKPPALIDLHHENRRQTVKIPETTRHAGVCNRTKHAKHVGRRLQAISFPVRYIVVTSTLPLEGLMKTLNEPMDGYICCPAIRPLPADCWLVQSYHIIAIDYIYAAFFFCKWLP